MNHVGFQLMHQTSWMQGTQDQVTESYQLSQIVSMCTILVQVLGIDIYTEHIGCKGKRLVRINTK